MECEARERSVIADLEVPPPGGSRSSIRTEKNRRKSREHGEETSGSCAAGESRFASRMTRAMPVHGRGVRLQIGYFFFFGVVLAMYSVTLTRKSFAAASISGSVIFGMSASIIASASVNLPELALSMAR